MKKLTFALLLVAGIFNTALSSEKGDFVIQPNLNLGGYGGFAGYSGFGIGATLNLDYAVHDYVSVGPWVGFTSRRQNLNDYSYSRIGFGARGVFHWWQLLDDKVQKDLKSDKIDFYLPVHLGYYFGTVRFDGEKFNEFSGNGFNAGSGLGIRYYFNEKIGLGFEWGWQEMSWSKLGVAIKL
jgi:hypothetical protein